VQLLRQEDMQRLPEELNARPEGDKASHMQGLLGQPEKEERLQEQEGRHKAGRGPRIIEAWLWLICLT